MEILKSIILGIIQGITEFLPVSSSGHLAIMHKILKFDMENNLFFDTTLHFGTLIAVIFFYRKDILSIILSFYKVVKNYEKTTSLKDNFYKDNNSKLGIFIIIAMIPTGIIGILLKDYVEKFAENLLFVGTALIITSIFLTIYELKKNSNKSIEKFAVKDAVIIGIMQGAAVFPGISRSGSTIATGKILGLEKELAANYSFLISIPAVLGAFLLQLKDLFQGEINIDISLFIIGFITSFISGYFSLKFLIWLIKKSGLKIFAVYCFLIGIIAVFYNIK